MTRGHLLSKIKDCVHAISVLKSQEPLTWQNLLKINDLEEMKSSLWKRVKKIKGHDNPTETQ